MYRTLMDRYRTSLLFIASYGASLRKWIRKLSSLIVDLWHTPMFNGSGLTDFEISSCVVIKTHS